MSQQTQLFQQMQQLRDSAVPFALITVVRVEPATAARVGDKAIVQADGTLHGWIGGQCSRTAVVKTAQEVLQIGEPQLIRVGPAGSGADLVGIRDFRSGCPSGGVMDIFIEPVIPAPTLVLFGDSPVAEALARLAPVLGFQVQGVPVAEHLAPVYAVVATQGRGDLAALEAALALPARYRGFIASRRKASSLLAKLRERGHEPALLDTIQAPAGIAINARTPEEVALSVLAAVVQVRRSGGVTVESSTAAPQAL